MKHLRISLLVALLAALVAGPAFATQTRINSLSGGEKNITIRDQANIWTLPQFLPDYGNQVDVDGTQGASYGTMSVRYALTDDAVILLYGKRSPWAPVVKQTTINGLDAGTIGGFAPVPADPTNHQFGIGFGTKLGESLRLGTHLSIGGNRADGDGNNLHSNTLIDFAFGLGFDLSETNSLDFGLNLQIGSFTNIEGGTDRYVSDGLIVFGLTAKGEFQVHQIAKIVPYLQFGVDNRAVFHAVRTDSPTFEAKKGSISNTQIQLGADLAISPAEGVLVQPGLGLTYRQSAADGNNQPNGQIFAQENSNQLMPYYGFAAEARAFDWMVLRLGARQTIITQNNQNTAPQGAPSNETHTSTVANTVTTGFGINLRGWQIDLNINPQFFNNGIFAVSGNATNPFAVDFAIVYDW